MHLFYRNHYPIGHIYVYVSNALKANSMKKSCLVRQNNPCQINNSLVPADFHPDMLMSIEVVCIISATGVRVIDTSRTERKFID